MVKCFLESKTCFLPIRLSKRNWWWWQPPCTGAHSVHLYTENWFCTVHLHWCCKPLGRISPSLQLNLTILAVEFNQSLTIMVKLFLESQTRFLPVGSSKGNWWWWQPPSTGVHSVHMHTENWFCTVHLHICYKPLGKIWPSLQLNLT